MPPSSLHRTQISVLRRIARARAVILGYHGVGRAARGDDLFLLQLTPERFQGQIEMLLAAGFEFVTVAEFARRAAGATPPPGLAAISFDDGLRNNLTEALPILQRLGVTATVYVPPAWLGGHSPWIGQDGDGEILTAPELCELARAGWEIGAHTMSHADLSLLDYDGCLREIEESCRTLGEITGTSVQTLAYPFGHYGPAAVAAARDAGLLAAVTTGSGNWEPFTMTRAMIGAADPFAVTLLKVTDRYEPLLRSPPMRVLRQASKDLRGTLNQRRQSSD